MDRRSAKDAAERTDGLAALDKIASVLLQAVIQGDENMIPTRRIVPPHFVNIVSTLY